MTELKRPAIRAVVDLAAEIRDSGTGLPVLRGHFAVFDSPTTISSWEGHFVEEIAAGAFGRTFTERRSAIRVLYEHGLDPQFGNKPLGRILELREDGRGAYYEVELFDNTLNREHVVPAARAGQLGASFKFTPIEEEWSTVNGVDHRRLTELKVYEFGPCPFPAYDTATAGIRAAQELGDREFLFRQYAALTEEERSSIARTYGLTLFDAAPAVVDHPEGPPPRQPEGPTRDERERWLRALELRVRYGQ